MKRNLLKQMGNEWRENIWLALELFVVLIAVWFLSAMTYHLVSVYTAPRGFDPEDVYYLEVKRLNEKSPRFTHFGEEAKARNGEDLLALLNRVRRSPNVEAAGVSLNGCPYQFSYFGTQIVPKGDSIYMYINMRIVSPDVARVLRFESLDGKTPEQHEALLRKGEFLLATYREYDRIRDPRKLMGRPLFANEDSTKTYISHALINNVCRSEFEERGVDRGTLIRSVSDDEVASGADIWDMLVRVKPGKEKAFMEEFGNSPDMRERRNVYLTPPVSLYKIRDNAHRSAVMNLRMLVGITFCLLVMVFLGLLGTFWYRIHRRESEIAIRKVNGATSGDILRRLLSEGMVLTALAGALAAVTAVICFSTDFLPDSETLNKCVMAGGVLAFGIVLIAVLAGISIPAKIAMRIEPAIALKDE